MTLMVCLALAFLEGSNLILISAIVSGYGVIFELWLQARMNIKCAEKCFSTMGMRDVWFLPCSIWSWHLTFKNILITNNISMLAINKIFKDPP